MAGSAAQRVDTEETRGDPAELDFVEGLPTPCPECEGPGYLACIDLHRRVKHESCFGCGHRWTTALPRSEKGRPAYLGRSTRTGLAARLARS